MASVVVVTTIFCTMVSLSEVLPNLIIMLVPTPMILENQFALKQFIYILYKVQSFVRTTALFLFLKKIVTI